MNLSNPTDAVSALQSVKPLETVYEIRKIEPGTAYVIPEVPSKRKCTDVFCIFFFLIYLITWASVAILYTRHSDYRRFTHGYDKCGNTCGLKNKPVKGINCTGQDMTKKPYLYLEHVVSLYENKSTKLWLSTHYYYGSCVEECTPPKKLIFNRCYITSNKNTSGVSFLDRACEDISKSYISIIFMCIVGAVLIFLAMLGLRWHMNIFVWLSLTIDFILMTVISGVLWWYYANKKDSSNEVTYLVSAIVTLFLAIIILLFILIGRTAIKRMAILLKYSVRALFDMPLLILHGFVILLLLIPIILLAYYTITIIWVSGTLQFKDGKYKYYDYKWSTGEYVAIVFTALGFIWLIALFLNCQFFVSAHAIIEYYFTRDKKTIKSPIYRAHYILIRFHMGTVMFGSFITAVIEVLIEILEFLMEQNAWDQNIYGVIIQCLLTCLKQLFNFLTRQAYVQTAMHGKSLCSSGQRAVSLLWHNSLETITNNVTTWLLLIAVTGTTLILSGVFALILNWAQRIQLTHFWIPVAIGVLVLFLPLYACLNALNASTEVVFQCYCEDKAMNNGVDRPYFMPPELIAFVEEEKARQMEERKKPPTQEGT